MFGTGSLFGCVFVSYSGYLTWFCGWVGCILGCYFVPFRLLLLLICVVYFVVVCVGVVMGCGCLF